MSSKAACQIALVMWAMVGLSGQRPDGSTIAVVVPESTSVRCSIDQAPLGMRANGVRILACPNNALIHCDGENVEPIDMLATEVCRTKRLQFVEADLLPIQVAQGGPITIEWLASSDSQIVTLAARTIASTELLSVPVARDSGRILRFSQPGLSPVTIDAHRLRTAKPWALPTLQPGGELVGLIEFATVLPISYRILGPTEAVWVSSESYDTVMSASGLTPGEYVIEPLYEGGIQGQAIATRVEPNKSTFLKLTAESVGTLEAIADGITNCSDVRARLILNQQLRAGGTAQSQLTIPTQPSCRTIIAGLPPGNHRLDLLLPSGVVAASDRVTIRPQTISRFVARSAAVQISGTVSVNGKPGSLLKVEFTEAQPLPLGPPAAANIMTDGSGYYSATLPTSGEYEVVLKDGDSMLANQKAVLQNGPNTLDWSVQGATLTVKVIGVRPGVPITIFIESSRSSQNAHISEIDEPLITKQGIPFDTYYVSATQDDLTTSTTTTIRLDANRPAGEVTVELIENNSMLVVVGESGSPIGGAYVRPMRPGSFLLPADLPLREAHAGVFNLTNLRPGTYLRIRAPGLVPMCRIVPANDLIVVTLSSGRPVSVQFPADVTAASLSTLAISGIPEADCPVPLTDFAPTIPANTGGSSTVNIEHFPSIQVLDLVSGRTVRQIVVPDVGPVLAAPRR